MKKNLLVAQSGGPSSAINATLSGILMEAIRSPEIDKVYGGANGIYGIISQQIADLSGQVRTTEDFKLLETTPGMALGSCRFKLPPAENDTKVYEKLVKIFHSYNIGYFLYIGGSNSMDTVWKLSRYLKDKGEDIKVLGVPKSVDNDLSGTDHTPGFGSAAKFIATSTEEIIRDSEAYPISSVTIIEVMGKESGWLTAASILPRHFGENAPHLVYLPEVPFSMGQFINDVQETMKKERAVVVVVSEGLKFSDGSYVAQPSDTPASDRFWSGRWSAPSAARSARWFSTSSSGAAGICSPPPTSPRPGGWGPTRYGTLWPEKPVRCWSSPACPIPPI